MVAVIVLIISACIVVVSGPVANQVGNAVGAGHAAVLVWDIAKWPLLLILVSFLLAILLWASPNAKQGGIRWISPGGIVATILWIVISAFFALYVTNFSSYDKTYGSLAGVVIFLVWLWLTNVALLLGAELNAELDHGRAIAEGLPDDVRPFTEPRDPQAQRGRPPNCRGSPRGPSILSRPRRVRSSLYDWRGSRRRPRTRGPPAGPSCSSSAPHPQPRTLCSRRQFDDLNALIASWASVAQPLVDSVLRVGSSSAGTPQR